MATQCITFLKRNIKAVKLFFIGRAIFCALLIIQSGFLAAYPAAYKDDNRWIPVFLLYIPALAYWIYCLQTEATLIRMFITWGLYVVFALIPSIAITYALVGDDLDKDKFLGPNTLKVVLCITPVLFLFVPNTASDLSKNEEYRELAFKLTIQITIDLFDAVEMLGIVLDERKNSHGIPKAFGIGMVAVACFSFLWVSRKLRPRKLRPQTRKTQTLWVSRKLRPEKLRPSGCLENSDPKNSDPLDVSKTQTRKNSDPYALKYRSKLFPISEIELPRSELHCRPPLFIFHYRHRNR